MTVTPDTLSKAERLQLAQRLVAAISADDLSAEHEVADIIGRTRFADVYAELDRITQELQDALCNVRVADQLSKLAHKELPGAQLRLNQVIDLTEDAANKTLTAVEEALPLAQRMVNAANDHLERWPENSPGLDADTRMLLKAVAADAGLLRTRLSDVMLAQGFQDLTGQIIKPVMRLVGELTSSLEATLGKANGAGEGQGPSSAGHGPAVPGLNADQAVNGQQDVDDLMSSLGL